MAICEIPKVAFFLDNSKISDVDFLVEKSGNPGCGASEFVMIQVASGLSRRGHKVCLYATALGKFPPHLNVKLVTNIEEAFKRSVVADEFWCIGLKFHQIHLSITNYRKSIKVD